MKIIYKILDGLVVGWENKLVDENKLVHKDKDDLEDGEYVLEVEIFGKPRYWLNIRLNGCFETDCLRQL